MSKVWFGGVLEYRDFHKKKFNPGENQGSSILGWKNKAVRPWRAEITLALVFSVGEMEGSLPFDIMLQVTLLIFYKI